MSMGFFEEPESAESLTPVWPTLDEDAKAEIVATLARMIAKTATTEQPVVASAEVRDE